MGSTPFAPPHWHFVPDDLDAGSLPAVVPLFDELAHRPLAGASDIERWLRDESELQSRIGAEQARRYIRMTRNTGDSAARDAYLAMERDVLPAVKLRTDELLHQQATGHRVRARRRCTARHDDVGTARARERLRGRQRHRQEGELDDHRSICAPTSITFSGGI